VVILRLVQLGLAAGEAAPAEQLLLANRLRLVRQVNRLRLRNQWDKAVLAAEALAGVAVISVCLWNRVFIWSN
jgi:hypothetical protein